MINRLSYINFKLQCFLSLQSNNIRFTSSPKHNGHLPLSTFRLIPLNCHIPANTHPNPLLSFLEQHSIYNSLPQEKFSSLYSVNYLFSGNFANVFCLSVSLHRSFTKLKFSLKLPSCFNAMNSVHFCSITLRSN